MLDIIIIALYCLLSLAIGLVSARHIHSMRDFAISHRNYDTFVIIATVSATLVGGGTTFGLASETFAHGIIYCLIISGAAINQLLVGVFIAPHMVSFRDYISVGEIMGSLYGKTGRVITGLSTLLISCGMLGAQIIAMGMIFNYFLGISHLAGIIIGAGIVILYSGIGGMRSVVATDILQFAILIIAIPLVCTVGIDRVDGYQGLREVLPPAHLSFAIPEDKLATYITQFATFCLVGAFYPSFIQRLLITRNIEQASRVALWSAFISLPFYFIVGSIGIIAFALSPTLPATDALPYLVNTLLPSGLKGLVIAGLLAVIMSTADSELNIGSVAIIHDILYPLGLIKQEDELRYARIITFLIGIMTIIIAMNFTRVLDLMLYAFNFWGPMILIPFTAGIFNIRIPVAGFVMAALCGILAMVLWNHFGAHICNGFIPGVVANALCFLGWYQYRRHRPSRPSHYHHV